ncbi:MAG: lipopolysaccharide transport periplasmic protein LptA [Gammaproteobacteria bacterium]|nr:lipopolysaccharide transport periplasmic protein LptA [Gammaproteobacteria bacterium]
MNKPTQFFFFLVLTLCYSIVHGLETDKSSPILIEANQVDMAEKSGISTYTGNVKLEQGSIKINADSIVVYTQNKKLQRIIATGSPATFSQKPDNQTDDVHASAQHVEYSSLSGMLILLNNANMQQGSNLFSGNRIEYDTNNDILSAKSSQKNNQRVKAVIQPETFTEIRKK